MTAAKEAIHSGQFMRSKVHAEDPDDDDDEYVNVVSSDPEEESEREGTNQKIHPPFSAAGLKRKESSGSRFSPSSASLDNDDDRNRDDKPVTFYKFGPRQTRSIVIDVTLNQLTKSIRQAYSNLTTPKWKDFKGMRLRWKERMRLNNVIWRAWHMEFVNKLKTKYCFFSMPSEDQHNRYEAAVLEGMYWKRRLETVASQYKRWRITKTRAGCFKRRLSKDVQDMKKAEGLFVPLPPEQSRTPQIDQTSLEDDDLTNVFTDRLFDSLNQPYMFPNPKEMAQAGKADFIQPGLLQLQPSLEEIMASLDANYPLTNDDPELGCLTGRLNSQSEEEPRRARSADYIPCSSLTRTEECHPSVGFSLLTECAENRSLMEPDSTLLPHLRIPAGLHNSGGIPQATVQTPLLYSQPAAYESPMAMVTENSGVIGKVSVTSWFQGNTSGDLSMDRIQPPSKGALKAFPDTVSFVREVKRQRKRKDSDMGNFRVTPKTTKTLVGHPLDHRDLAPSLNPGGQLLVSAFSPVGNSGFSPATPAAAALKNSTIDSPGAACFDTIRPSNVQPFFSPGSPSQPPYFIVQPCSTVQLPLVALPCSTTVASLDSLSGTQTVKKEKETLPVSVSVYTRQLSVQNSGTSKSPAAATPAPIKPKLARRVAADSTVDPMERKRMLHLHAEQSRRSALKGGFEQLEELLPNLQVTTTKPTNAAVLAKAGDYIRELQQQCELKQTQVQELNEEISTLNDKITAYQTHLPASGTSGKTGKVALQQMFSNYVKNRSEQNCKFWLFSKLMEPLFESYKNEIEGVTVEEISRSARDWSGKHCQRLLLRPVASKVLVSLATDTPLLTDPASFPQFVKKQLE